MNANDLRDAIYNLDWGSSQVEQSASLSPAQCRALSEYIDELEKRRERQQVDEVREVHA